MHHIETWTSGRKNPARVIITRHVKVKKHASVEETDSDEQPIKVFKAKAIEPEECVTERLQRGKKPENDLNYELHKSVVS